KPIVERLMTKNRLIQLIALGSLCASAAVIAQQKALVPAVTERRPNFGNVVPKPEGALPKVPAGFTVELYADNVPGARLMEFAPSGDLFVPQPAQTAVMVLRDTNKDGKPDERFTFAQGAPPAQRGAPPAGGGAGGPGRGAGAASGEMLQPFGLAFQPGYL